MGLFGRKKKDASTLAAEKLDGRELLYLARRYIDAEGNSQEEGIGKDGRINTANGHVILTCGEKEIFCNSNIESVQCAELLSLGGAIFTGYNEISREEETIVVYYKTRFRQ